MRTFRLGSVVPFLFPFVFLVLSVGCAQDPEPTAGLRAEAAAASSAALGPKRAAEPVSSAKPKKLDTVDRTALQEPPAPMDRHSPHSFELVPHVEVRAPEWEPLGPVGSHAHPAFDPHTSVPLPPDELAVRIRANEAKKHLRGEEVFEMTVGWPDTP